MSEYSVNHIVIGAVVAIAVFTVVILIIYFCFCKKKAVIQHKNKEDCDLASECIASMIQQKSLCKFSIENENYDFSHLRDQGQKKIISGIKELVQKENLTSLGKDLKRMVSNELVNYFVDKGFCEGEFFLISIYHFYFIANQTDGKEFEAINKIVLLMMLCEASYNMEGQKIASGLGLDEESNNRLLHYHSFWRKNGFHLLKYILEYTQSQLSFVRSQEKEVYSCICIVNELRNEYKKDILLAKIVRKYRIACNDLQKVCVIMQKPNFRQYCIARKNDNLKKIIMDVFSLPDERFLIDQSWMDREKITDFCFEDDDFKKCISSGNLPITMFVSKIDRNNKKEKITSAFLEKMNIELQKASNFSGDLDTNGNYNEENDDNVNTFDNCCKIVNNAIDVITQYIQKDYENATQCDEVQEEKEEKADSDIEYMLNKIVDNVKAMNIKNKKHLLSDIIYNIINEGYFDFEHILPELLLKYNHESTNLTDTASNDSDASSDVENGIDPDAYLDITKIIDHSKRFDEKDKPYDGESQNQFYKIACSVFDEYKKKHLDPLENNKQDIEDIFKIIKFYFNVNSRVHYRAKKSLSDIYLKDDKTDSFETESFFSKDVLISILFSCINNLFEGSQSKPFPSTEGQNFAIGDAESVFLPSGAENIVVVQ